MTAYEYVVASIPIDNSNRVLDKFADLGAAGYELVTIIPLAEFNGEHGLAYFKRPVPPEPKE